MIDNKQVEQNNTFDDYSFVEEEVEDFEAFINKQYDNSKIIDEASANNYIRRIKNNKKLVERKEQIAKNIITNYSDKVNLWRDNEIEKLNRDSEYCTKLLLEYYNSIAKGNNKIKIKLPEGTIGYYKNKRSISVDKKKVKDFIASLPENEKDKFKDYIKIVNDIDLDYDKLKKDGIPDEVNNIFKVCNIAIPGITVKASSEEFKTR